jgi:hypothetical protein
VDQKQLSLIGGALTQFIFTKSIPGALRHSGKLFHKPFKHELPNRFIPVSFHEIRDEDEQENPCFNQERETPKYKNEETGEVEVI